MMKPKSKTFCILPWMSIATSPSGSLRLCCNSVPYKNLILKPNGAPYKIYDNLKEAWHSPTYKQIRRQMLNGERLKMCAYCFQKEDALSESPRLFFNKQWMFDYEDSETPEMKVKYLDIRLGNLCNLRCRMCNPYTSNQWIKEWDKLAELNASPSIKPFAQDEKKRFKNLNYPEKIDFPKFVKYIKSSEWDLSEIYFTGGEPMLIEQHYVFLNELIKQDLSQNMILKYNTNITKFSIKKLYCWKFFKRIRLHISIDGFGKLNNYIRYPSQWNKIEENMKKINILNKEIFNITTEIHITTQMYNILSMTELLSWIKDKNMDVVFNILDYPECLNIQVLPADLKKKAAKELLLFQNDFPVTEVINYMTKEDQSHYLGDFFHYTDFLDKSRNQNIDEVLPELSSYRCT